MTPYTSAASSPAPVPSTRDRPRGARVAEGATAIVVILDPDGHVQVIDLLAHSEGPRLLDAITAHPQHDHLAAATCDDDGPRGAPVAPDERSVDLPGDAPVDNVVRLPAPQLPRLLRALPTPQVAGPYGRPVLVEDQSDDGAVRWIEFSPREFEVLQLIVAGCSNQQIAEHLFLGINTVKSYVRTSYRKIPVTTRAQAVRWGLLHGLGFDHETT